MKPILPASISALQVVTVGPEECHAWSTEAAKKGIQMEVKRVVQWLKKKNIFGIALQK